MSKRTESRLRSLERLLGPEPRPQDCRHQSTQPGGRACWSHEQLVAESLDQNPGNPSRVYGHGQRCLVQLLGESSDAEPPPAIPPNLGRRLLEAAKLGIGMGGVMTDVKQRLRKVEKVIGKVLKEPVTMRITNPYDDERPILMLAHFFKPGV